MNKHIRWTGALSAVVFVAGCGSPVFLTSEPKEAEVAIDSGVVLGVTPISMGPYGGVFGSPGGAFEVRKDGYHFKKITLNANTPPKMHVTLDPVPPPPKLASGQIMLDVIYTDKGLVVQRQTVHAEENVIERSPNVKAVRRLTDLPENRWLQRFRLFPDGTRMLMDIIDREAPEGATEIFFSNLWDMDVRIGGAMQRRTEGKYFDADGCFSPEGKFIFFSSNRSGKQSIFRLDVDGAKGLGLITSGGTQDTRPEVAPDDSAILYTAKMAASEIPQLWSQPLTPGLPMQLREGEGPRWSPDCKLVMFSRIDRTSSQTKIWTMRPDSSEPVQLSQGAEHSDIDPCWSPDGKYIVFASNRGQAGGQRNYDIWIMGTDGANPKQLTTNGSVDDRPVISKDGKTIYFRSNRGLKWDIWVLELAEPLPVAK